MWSKKNKVSVADKKKKLYNRVMDEKRITTDQTTIRINKYLSAAGVCSRREADQLTDAGRVTVAGKEIGTGERIPADAEDFFGWQTGEGRDQAGTSAFL